MVRNLRYSFSRKKGVASLFSNSLNNIICSFLKDFKKLPFVLALDIFFFLKLDYKFGNFLDLYV